VAELLENHSQIRPGEPSPILELVNYQEGTIVSKTIYSAKSGTITLFAFDEGQGLSEHTAPFDALVQMLDGKAKLTVSGKNFEASSGDMVLLPSNQAHSLLAVSKFKMILTMIR
jgi:quercetin dioxygenase-like cupin family protein